MTFRPQAEKFALYALRAGSLVELATGPDEDSMGLAFGTLLKEGTIEQEDAIGVHVSADSPRWVGQWRLTPYGRGGRR